MKIKIVHETLNVAGVLTTKFVRKKIFEKGDMFLVTSSPGAMAFKSGLEYQHWSKKADGRYPVLISIDFIDEPHFEIVVHLFIPKPHLNSTEMSIHRMSKDYFESRRFIFDHYTT